MPSKRAAKKFLHAFRVASSLVFIPKNTEASKNSLGEPGRIEALPGRVETLAKPREGFTEYPRLPRQGNPDKSFSQFLPAPEEIGPVQDIHIVVISNFTKLRGVDVRVFDLEPGDADLDDRIDIFKNRSLQCFSRKFPVFRQHIADRGESVRDRIVDVGAEQVENERRDVQQDAGMNVIDLRMKVRADGQQGAFSVLDGPRLAGILDGDIAHSG